MTRILFLFSPDAKYLVSGSIDGPGLEKGYLTHKIIESAYNSFSMINWTNIITNKLKLK